MDPKKTTQRSDGISPKLTFNIKGFWGFGVLTETSNHAIRRGKA